MKIPHTALALLALVLIKPLAGCKRADTEIDALKSEVSALKSKQEWNKLEKNFESIAYLTPGDAGYSSVRFELGFLAVQLADVKPYANGSKITLEFGNPLAATINGLKFAVDWGKVEPNKGPVNETAQKKDVVLAEPIQSASWTSIHIVLEGLPPSDLGFVRVHDVKHAGIVLR